MRTIVFSALAVTFLACGEADQKTAPIDNQNNLENNVLNNANNIDQNNLQCADLQIADGGECRLTNVLSLFVGITKFEESQIESFYVRGLSEDREVNTSGEDCEFLIVGELQNVGPTTPEVYGEDDVALDAGRVRFITEDGDVRFEPDGDGYVIAGDGTIPAGQTIQVEVDGGEEIGAIDLEMIGPKPMEESDIPMWESGVDYAVQWDSSEGRDALIIVEVRDQAQQTSVIRCEPENTGTFTIPSEFFTTDDPYAMFVTVATVDTETHAVGDAFVMTKSISASRASTWISATQ